MLDKPRLGKQEMNRGFSNAKKPFHTDLPKKSHIFFPAFASLVNYLAQTTSKDKIAKKSGVNCNYLNNFYKNNRGAQIVKLEEILLTELVDKKTF